MDAVGGPLCRMLMDDPAAPEALAEAVESKVLPLLGPITTLDAFVTLANSQPRFMLNPLRAFPLRNVVVQTAMGNLDEARAICESQERRPAEYWEYEKIRFGRVMGELYPLLKAGDRQGVIDLLHKWQAMTVKNLELESVWEKTPLPVELLPG